jgi:hypothetical protein
VTPGVRPGAAGETQAPRRRAASESPSPSQCLAVALAAHREHASTVTVTCDCQRLPGAQAASFSASGNLASPGLPVSNGPFRDRDCGRRGPATE